MSRQELVRKPDFTTDFANFVFVERSERLHYAPGLDQSLYAGHPIMVRLDEVRLGRTSGFDRIGIDRPLSQNPMAVEEMLGRKNPFLNLDELLSDGTAF